MRGKLTLLLVLTGVLAAGTLPGGAAAGHDPTGPDGHPVNFTWTPYDLSGGPSNNHLPGLDDASHASLSTSQNPGGFKRLQFVVVRSDDVDFGDCSAQQTRAFGIDRGNDEPGTTIDEDLLDNYEQSTFEADRIVIDFYEDSDFGGNAPYINSSDQLVSAVANCFGNPDEPGWYRVKGKLNGTTWEEEEQALNPYSHYFYICECESEAEARNKLGPPPSERDGGGATPTPTPTPAGTATPTPTPTATPEQGTGGSTPTATGAGSGPGATPTDGSGDATPTTAPSAATPTRPASGDESGVPTTPTFADGPGFGAAAALGALLVAAALALRD